MKREKGAARVIPIQPAGEAGSLFAADAKVYPRAVKGHFQRWRWLFVWLTQCVFYGLCWLPWHGRQAVLFDLERRRFYLFDLVLWPQDVIYLALLLVLSALALFLFTTVAGRLWCGYSCPQTVYTEMFQWLERCIEGDRPRRIKLDAAPWSVRKLAIKSGKHGAWLVLALWTGFTFVGYFTPIRDLARAMLAMSPSGWEVFWILFYAGLTYGNAGFMREQMCKYICPYAQFQSVMFDADTLVITYDVQRGDPRGGRSRQVKAREQGLGDCVDCGICVQVCPTGIDIRDGLQLECIGCAACIDACDQVMDKMAYPRGLIRYATENEMRQPVAQRTMTMGRRLLRPRVLVYAVAVLGLSGAMLGSLLTRMPLKVDVLRDRAVLAREMADGAVENTFRLQLTNASEQARRYRVEVDGFDGLRVQQHGEIGVPAADTAAVVLQVHADGGAVASGAHTIRFIVTAQDDGQVRVEAPSTFWMP